MGRGSNGDFSTRDRAAARNFARMARREGVGRVIYLGGLGEPGSPHLRSRHETAGVLAAEGPPLTYFRAAMVVGAGSESFRTLYYLAKRLPVMVAPAWLRVRTQPIGIEDVLAYLRAAPDTPASEGRTIEIGGADVITYGDMLRVTARELGRRQPRMLPVPLLTPKLSSLWIGLVTPVDVDVARPLIEGLSTETVVTDPLRRGPVRRRSRAVRRDRAASARARLAREVGDHPAGERLGAAQLVRPARRRLDKALGDRLEQIARAVEREVDADPRGGAGGLAVGGPQRLEPPFAFLTGWFPADHAGGAVRRVADHDPLPGQRVAPPDRDLDRAAGGRRGSGKSANTKAASAPSASSRQRRSLAWKWRRSWKAPNSSRSAAP